MATLQQLDQTQLQQLLTELTARYEQYRARGLKLDMSRGKPGAGQLDLTNDMLTCLRPEDGFRSEAGIDVRNYGLMDGIPEMKRIFSRLLGVPEENLIVAGNSSLNLMFDYICTAFAKGVCGRTPWSREEKLKFLCPAPGYDRHFAITEYFGFELITVPMTGTGPDMDRVEDLVRDPAVKGIWCVPMYSNPDGITYSDETVRRFAALKPAAPDFRIMWDNAYCVHHLTDTPDRLLNLFEEARARGNEDLVLEFASTSKISFPGAGVAVVAASAANIADIKSRMKVQTIGFDKINMLRHARYFKDADGVLAHMKKQAALLRPHFEIVLQTLERELGPLGIARWHKPNGGYFVSVNLLPGCAKETVRLCREAGVVLTGAGATFPYGRDPQDSNLRIAPTFPPLDELQTAIDLFCICAQIASVKKRLGTL
ncbi:MAG: aminotransferase class I/II-fold pyridoxal phosphate-dependent enzyme [Clostridia bacterium]|nr:aminotransferase class I/II-fold pyridoxal phosphate-dependent enzyme [Clostridia bacterium]